MKGKLSLPNLTHERVRDVLNYNPATGEFVWKVSLSKNVKAGTQAGGSAKGSSYRYVTVDGIEIPAARLAWFYMNGEWPRTKVQFVDRDKTNLKFNNLVLSVGTHGEFDFKTREGRIAYQRERRKANPELERARSLRESFSLSLEQYQEMHDRQEGKCAICGQPETQFRQGKLRALAVDHNHTTGKVRELLCSDCNTGIGKLKEDQNVLLNAIKYLQKHTTGASSTEAPVFDLGPPALRTDLADSAQTSGLNLVQEV